MSEFFDTPLADVITLQNDKKSQLKTSQYQSSGVLPIIDQSSSFVCGYTDDCSKKYSKGLPVIVFGDHTLHTKYIDFDFAVGADGTQIIKTLDSHHDHKYLYYVISREIQMMGSEGYKRHLNILKERVVPFINSIPEQKKIASILTSIDEVIEKTQLQINKLQDLKKGTMNELLTKGIDHTEFKDSELGRIPEDWSSVCLGDYAYIKARIGWRGLSSSEYTVSGPYLIAGKHIKGSGVDWLNCDHINDFRYEESREIQLQENDIIISKDGTIGRLAFIDYLPGKATINGTMMLIRTEKNFHSKYVYFYLQGDNFQKLIREKVSGSSIPHIFQRDMITFNLPMPPLTEQKKIVSILTPIDKTIEDKQCKLHQTQSLKKSLMQDLLTGKVRVTVN